MQQYVHDKPNKPLMISIDTEIGQLEQFSNNWLVAIGHPTIIQQISVSNMSLNCHSSFHCGL
jgi:hypothetical protein